MTTVDIGIREKDFYTQLMAEIEAGNVERAVEMVVGLPELEEQVGVLSLLARDLARAHDRGLDFDLDLARALASARALAIDLDLDRVRDRANSINNTIISCLEVLTGVGNQEEASNTFQLTLTGINTLTPHNLANTIQADIELKRAQSAQLQAESEKTRFEIEKARINMALSIIKEYAPKLSETERLTYLTRLLQPLGVLIESPLKPVTLPEG